MSGDDAALLEDDDARAILCGMTGGEHVPGIIDEKGGSVLLAADHGRFRRARQWLHDGSVMRLHRYPGLPCRRHGHNRSEAADETAKQVQASTHHAAPSRMAATTGQFTRTPFPA